MTLAREKAATHERDEIARLRRELPWVRVEKDYVFGDEAGEVRLIVRVMNWEDYVHLAFDEIRMAGAGSPQVARRLKAALTDLKSVAPADRIPILDHQLELQRLLRQL